MKLLYKNTYIYSPFYLQKGFSDWMMTVCIEHSDACMRCLFDIQSFFLRLLSPLSIKKKKEKINNKFVHRLMIVFFSFETAGRISPETGRFFWTGTPLFAERYMFFHYKNVGTYFGWKLHVFCEICKWKTKIPKGTPGGICIRKKKQSYWSQEKKTHKWNNVNYRFNDAGEISLFLIFKANQASTHSHVIIQAYMFTASVQVYKDARLPLAFTILM